MMRTAILTLACPDRPGLVSAISGFIYSHGGNILNLNEFVDSDSRTFFLRVAWDMENFKFSETEISKAFTELIKGTEAAWEISFSGKKIKLAVFVSRYDHCLREVLWRYQNGEFQLEIPLIISNHPDLKSVADRYEIPFFHFPINQENREETEKAELELLRKHQVHSIVLARYMQILSPEFVSHYPQRIINIHHSFLPAFVGGNPYRQAFERGVKIIGATSHFVTEVLDEGPIIVQDTSHITHRDRVDDLVRKGRDLERLVLSKAIKLHAERRVLVSGRKTVVFE